jgi:hypothetical protein
MNTPCLPSHLVAERAEAPLNRCLGRFHISLEEAWRSPAAMMPYFADMVVLQAERLAHLDIIEVTAVSRQFDPISPIYIPPLYRAKISERPNGQRVVSFVRRG